MPIVLLVLAGLLGAPVEIDAGASEGLSLVSAINIAGRQRMLSQRILLAYCQAGLGVMPDAARRRLAESVRLFDTQLAELKGFAPTPEVRDTLAQVEEVWTPFREIVRQPPSREGARRLLFWNDDLLFTADKVVRLLQDLSDQPYARLVNIAGRQRMLSQRAAKFYMLREWGFDRPSIRDEMARARNEFAGALAALRAAPENTDAILAALDEAEMSWTWFDHALSLRGGEHYRLIVADSTEAILVQMDRVTGMYERLATRDRQDAAKARE
ncbi:MAG: type IV pili methyl-accepting chemotaxis transducer N-terminal domain-containing protein [Rhodospirillales bacterium]